MGVLVLLGVRGQKAEIRNQKAEIRNRKIEIRSQKLGIGGKLQKIEIDILVSLCRTKSFETL